MSKVTDPDLMMLADGELDAAEASALERAAGANGSLKVAAVREVGDLVRGHLELAADDAEDRLNGLWDLVERRLDRDEVAATKTETRTDATPASPGLWSRVVKWFDGHRAHLLTGALSAGAVAALAFVLREDPRVEYRDRIIKEPIAVVQPDAGTNPMVLVATPPEVESLEVNGGTGTVFTIEDDDGGTETAVIWVTPDDVLEGI